MWVKIRFWFDGTKDDIKTNTKTWKDVWKNLDTKVKNKAGKTEIAASKVVDLNTEEK